MSDAGCSSKSRADRTAITSGNGELSRLYPTMILNHSNRDFTILVNYAGSRPRQTPRLRLVADSTKDAENPSALG